MLFTAALLKLTLDSNVEIPLLDAREAIEDLEQTATETETIFFLVGVSFFSFFGLEGLAKEKILTSEKPGLKEDKGNLNVFLMI